MEIWKEIRGYEDYEVSNLGRVKSIARTLHTDRGDRFYKEKVLTHNLGDNYYLRVNLYKNGKPKTKRIHQLVAEAFLNHKPNAHKLVVDHQNSIKTDNRLENLQIITQRENTSKDRKGGTSKHTGVCWVKSKSKWEVKIFINGKNKFIGLFTNELKAAEAYKTALKELLCTK